MLLLLLCTRFCLTLDSFPKALYNSDMKATKLNKKYKQSKLV